jgi:hypothetical protein
VRLTSWRSAANAPDEYPIPMTILGAFGSCNGVLASGEGLLEGEQNVTPAAPCALSAEAEGLRQIWRVAGRE